MHNSLAFESLVAIPNFSGRSIDSLLDKFTYEGPIIFIDLLVEYRGTYSEISNITTASTKKRRGLENDFLFLFPPYFAFVKGGKNSEVKPSNPFSLITLSF